MKRDGDWMQTFTGVQFWPLDPKVDEIRLEDIAHSLSLQCRFAGHCTEFYSVAQHSVLVSQNVPPADALWGLLHDAAEAYLVDLPRPVKRYSTMGTLYRQIEERVMLVICAKFGLGEMMPDSVHTADDVILMTEKRDLMPNCPAKWRETAAPLDACIIPWPPRVAEYKFLYYAERLLKGELKNEHR